MRRVTKTWGQHYCGIKIISCYTLAIINGVQRVSIKYDLAGSVRREREQMVNGTIRLFDTNRIYRDWNCAVFLSFAVGKFTLLIMKRNVDARCSFISIQISFGLIINK